MQKNNLNDNPNEYINVIQEFFLADDATRYGRNLQREKHFELIALFNQLKDESLRSSFIDAVCLVYESTPPLPQYAEKLYVLLELIMYLVPFRIKNKLREQLYRNECATIYYGSQSILNLILLANSKYNIDDQLLTYLRNEFKSSKNLTKMMFLFRILSYIDLKTTLRDFVFAIKNLLINESENQIIKSYLEDDFDLMIDKFGFEQFYQWYTKILVPEFDYDDLPLVLIRDSLFEIIKKVDRNYSDGYSLLLRIRLFVQKGILVPVEDIAKLAKIFEGEIVPKDIIEQEMQHLRNAKEPIYIIDISEKLGHRTRINTLISYSEGKEPHPLYLTNEAFKMVSKNLN